MKTQPDHIHINPWWFFAKIGIFCALGLGVLIQGYAIFNRNRDLVVSSKIGVKIEKPERALAMTRDEVRQALAEDMHKQMQKSGPPKKKPPLNKALLDPKTYAQVKKDFVRRLDGPYGKLYKQLGLNADQLQELRGLLAEKELALVEGYQLARSSNIRLNSADLNALRNESDGAIRSLLGDAAFSSYKNYESTLGARNQVDILEERLSYKTEPLTSNQYDDLVTALSKLTNANRNPASNAWMGDYCPKTTQRTLEIAKDILTPSQFAVYAKDYEQSQASSAIAREYSKKFAVTPKESRTKSNSKSNKAKSTKGRSAQ